ncbi:hypothetical protein BH24ACT7_BH24ACT7_24110 [soil metagenome]
MEWNGHSGLTTGEYVGKSGVLPDALPSVIRVRPTDPATSWRRVRCGTCRARSWRTTGDNSDTLGVVVVGAGEMYWVPAPRREGQPGRRLLPSYITELLDHPDRVVSFAELGRFERLTADRRITAGLRVRCRHGHDLRVSYDRLHQLATAGTVDTIHI